MNNRAVKASRNRKKPAPINAEPVRQEEFEGLETELCGIIVSFPS